METAKYIGENVLEKTSYINDIKESVGVVRFIKTAKELHETNEWKDNYDYFSDDTDVRVQTKYGDKFIGAYITDAVNEYGKPRVFYIIESDRKGHCYCLNEVSQYGGIISSGNTQLCTVTNDTINFHNAYHPKGTELANFSKKLGEKGKYLIIH